MLTLSFVCSGCAGGDHGSCRGGTWCPCQHRKGKKTEPETSTPAGE